MRKGNCLLRSEVGTRKKKGKGKVSYGIMSRGRSEKLGAERKRKEGKLVSKNGKTQQDGRLQAKRAKGHSVRKVVPVKNKIEQTRAKKRAGVKKTFRETPLGKKTERAKSKQGNRNSTE